MTVEIEVGEELVQFRLDWKQSRWQSPESLDESLFPLITFVEGRRYELYSDGTFENVEL